MGKRGPKPKQKGTPFIPHDTIPGKDVNGYFLPGNRIWNARSSCGRKPTFENPDALWKAASEYFDWVEQHPLKEEKIFHANGLITKDTINKIRAMTISGLCLFLDITAQTWSVYKSKPAFAEICSAIEKIIYNQKFEGAAADLLNHAIIARELGLADKTELTGKDGGPIAQAVSVDAPPPFNNIDEWEAWHAKKKAE